MPSGEILEVEDGVVRVIQKTISRQFPLEELLKRVEYIPPITLPTIARSQVFAQYTRDPSTGYTTMYALCELAPGTRSITKNVRRGGRGLRRYRLSMPWTYFWFVANTTQRIPATSIRWSVFDAKVFMARDQYDNPDSPMIVAPLPNLSQDGAICYGNTSVDGNVSLARQLDQRVADWYLTDFNDDLDGNVRLPYGEPNMKRWVDESRENPASWRDWPEWNDTSRRITVKKLIEDSGVEVEFVDRFVSGLFIPPVELPLTFGAWDEWWESIPLDQRTRAQRSLENNLADSPEFIPAAEENMATAPVVDDDGSVPA